MKHLSMNRLFRNRNLKYILVCVFFSASCIAAEPGHDTLDHQKEITLYGGIWNLASIDELYSFQKYSGNNLFGGISFGVKSSRTRHLITVQYANITRKPDAEVRSNDFIESRYKEMKSMMLDFNYSFQKRLKPGHMKVFVTANWLNSFNYTTNEDDPEVFLSSLAPGLLIQYEIKKHTFAIDGAIPVISLALRDPYHISQTQTDDYSERDYLKENLKIRSLGNLVVLCAQMNYRYQLSPSFLIDARYQFRYISYKEPRPLRSVSGIYSAGFTFIF